MHPPSWRIVLPMGEPNRASAPSIDLADLTVVGSLNESSGLMAGDYRNRMGHSSPVERGDALRNPLGRQLLLGYWRAVALT
jgi:hypothetical protein